MDLPETYLEQLKKISVQFEKNRKEEDEDLNLNSRLGRRIVRVRREYSNFSHWSRFGSLPKKSGQGYNPESNRKPMTARGNMMEIEQV